MAQSGTVGQFFCSGNEQVYLEGGGNKSKILNSRACRLFSEGSTIIISSSSNIRLRITDSSISLDRGVDANLNGTQNGVYVEDFENLLSLGANNNLVIQKMKDLVWSGSNGQCHVGRSTNISIFGLRNEIVGNRNSDILICGNDNTVIANENKNLKVRGHFNQVEAISTTHITVDENDNQVTLSECSRHSFKRAKLYPMTIPESRVVFHGILTKCSIFEGILCPPERFATVKLEPAVNSTEPPIPTDHVSHNQELTMKQSNFAVVVMPQIQVDYVDTVSVNKSLYSLGIFHMKIEGLSERHRRHTPVKVTVNGNELDRESLYYTKSPCGKMVTYSGSKGGAGQSLVLVGNQITVNIDGTCYVHLIEIQEEQVEEDEGVLEE